MANNTGSSASYRNYIQILLTNKDIYCIVLTVHLSPIRVGPDKILSYPEVGSHIARKVISSSRSLASSVKAIENAINSKTAFTSASQIIQFFIGIGEYISSLPTTPSAHMWSQMTSYLIQIFNNARNMVQEAVHMLEDIKLYLSDPKKYNHIAYRHKMGIKVLDTYT